MLSIGQQFNMGHQLIMAATIFRKGKPDGATILAAGDLGNGKGTQYVTGVVNQADIESPTPVREWFWGHYFEGKETSAEDALRDFMERAEIVAFTN